MLQYIEHVENMENALETSDYIPKQEIDMFNTDSLYIPYSIQNELEIL